MNSLEHKASFLRITLLSILNRYMVFPLLLRWKPLTSTYSSWGEDWWRGIKKPLHISSNETTRLGVKAWIAVSVLTSILCLLNQQQPVNSPFDLEKYHHFNSFHMLWQLSPPVLYSHSHDSCLRLSSDNSQIPCYCITGCILALLICLCTYCSCRH